MSEPRPAEASSASPSPKQRPSSHSAAGQPAAPSAWDQMGGIGGMIDSALPVIVFVLVKTVSSLGWAIGAAVATAAVVSVIRLRRREPLGQAIGGLIGVAIAAFIANRTGSAKGFFLLGIWSFVVYGAVLVLSILLRRPLIGVIWENLNGRGKNWRNDRTLVRKYDLATLLWVLVCAARFVVQRWLYSTDQVGWLAFARITMGYPMFILAIIGTALIVNSGSGLSPRQQWQQVRDRRRSGPQNKALTFKQRYAMAKAAQQHRPADQRDTAGNQRHREASDQQ